MDSTEKCILAVDLGASSGRLVAGLFDGERLALHDVHRFDNGGVTVGDRMYWDILRLWGHLKDGLRAARTEYSSRISSIGVDTWGVDFGLLGRNDELLGNPYHYRDRRTEGILGKAFEIVSREAIFAETGLQFMQFNSLYQLLAMKLSDSPLIDAAQALLMIPDLFHWMMTGVKGCERTNASTTQFYNPQTATWAMSLLERFGLPTGLLVEIVEPGSKIGQLQKNVQEETGLPAVDVLLPGTHDTASAVMAVPAVASEKPDWCYISSGTWSLMGVEVPQPIVTDKCRELNFTNEGGIGGTTRLLKNIAGLWIVQECRRIWDISGKQFSWDQLVQMAESSQPLVSLVDPDDSRFVAPADMPEAIGDFCQQTSQTVPQNEGAIIRCALESLALRYRLVLGWLEELIDGRIETIHIVGGGTQNRLLCQMAADACNRPVVAGPIEATAIGNVMMQAVASQDVGSIAEARDVIRNSFDVHEYTPQQPAPWDEAFAKFRSMPR